MALRQSAAHKGELGDGSAAGTELASAPIEYVSETMLCVYALDMLDDNFAALHARQRKPVHKGGSPTPSIARRPTG
jgi:hypothetical protein